MRRIQLRLSTDHGSIPIALLGIIALTTIVGALVATTIGGSRAARFDQQYTEVIQVADAGAQAGAQHLLRAVDPEDLQDATAPYTGSGTLDGTPYTWVAERRPTGECRTTGTVANCWRITGTATSPGAGGVAPVTRDVALQISDHSRFFVAAFSDVAIRLRGGNAASSYIPGGGYDLGNGIVGSNGTIRLNGNTYVDGVQLFNFQGALADYGRCDGSNEIGQCGDLLHTDGPRWPSATREEPLSIGPGAELDTTFIDEAISERCPAAPASWRASDHGGVLGSTTGGSEQVLCVTDLIIDQDTIVRAGVSIEVFVYGAFTVSNHTSLNCTGCTETSTPDTTRLRIYSDGGAVSIGNHTHVAAAIYAPESDCGGNPSNAQGEIYGSLICREISNQGGWNFHFDEQLRDLGTGNYDVHAWWER